MPWPGAADYNDALQNLRTRVNDPELQEGVVVELDEWGLPQPSAGGFAAVYRVHCPATGNDWAMKCFTKEVRGLTERYRLISEHLQRLRLPFMVEFHMVEDGIRVGRERYPFLKMQWVEGVNLNRFVGECRRQTATLERLAELWVKLAARLREAQIAHADLQHGNVLLVPVPGTERLGLKLIDYDGMYVPALAGTRSGELGHPAFQHPQRLREGTYNAEVDRFSQLAIACALRCLVVNPDLWRPDYDTGENLLFRQADFAKPSESALFHELWSLRDPDAKALVGQLALAAAGHVADVPQLDKLIVGAKVTALQPDQQRQVEQWLTGDGPPRPVRPPRKKDSPEPAPQPETVAATPGPVVVTCVFGHSLTVTPQASGQEVPCPECGWPIAVPAASGGVAQNPREASAAEPTRTPLAARPRRSTAKGVPAGFAWLAEWCRRGVQQGDRLLQTWVGPNHALVLNILRVLLPMCLLAGLVGPAYWFTAHRHPSEPGGIKRAAAKERLHASLRKLRLWTIDGGGGVGGGGSGGGGGGQEDAGKENVDA